MASREIGKMLDELMGNHRNLNPDDKVAIQENIWSFGLQTKVWFLVEPGGTVFYIFNAI